MTPSGFLAHRKKGDATSLFNMRLVPWTDLVLPTLENILTFQDQDLYGTAGT